ncbi:MAG: ABC transporter substrate-binding protein, partial [Halobaculum sp.]
AEIDMSGVPNVHYDPDAVTVEREEAGRKTGTYELAGRTLNYVNVTPLTVFYLAFDTTSVPRAVRRAVAYVHDQAADTAAAFKGRRSAAYHLTPRVLYPGGPEAAEAHAATYPYGQGVDVERARGETEAAGYGPDDRFAFEFAVTPSQDWKRLADILQERLAAAHVDMSVRTMDARELQEAGAAGELDAYYGGWIADWPAAESAIRPLDPDRSDTDEDDPLTYTNWTGPAAERARAAFDRLRANTGPGEAAAAARAEAVVAAERANWEDVAILPTYQYVSESVWHRWIDTPLPGPLGFRRLKHHEVTVGERE